MDLSEEKSAELVALDDALIDARNSRVVELRFSAGLRVEETAEVLEVSAETVMRDLKTAKVWLREVSQE
jgi:DNA-directed RNA polymerase specialized sigma24 family protein